MEVYHKNKHRKYQAPSLKVVELEQHDIMTTSVYTTTFTKKYQTTFTMSPWGELTGDDDGKITSIN